MGRVQRLVRRSRRARLGSRDRCGEPPVLRVGARSKTPARPRRRVRMPALSRLCRGRSVTGMKVALRTHSGYVELAIAVGLYALYEVVRGFGSTSLAAARAHTADIVALEQHLGFFVER